MTLKVIAHIHTAFPTKFGIPRQSAGGRPAGRDHLHPGIPQRRCLRGLEDFSHIWLVWQFSGAVRESWSPTVRPRAWRQHPDGRVCHPLPLPAQSAGPFQRQAGGHRAPPGGGPGAHRAGRRPDGRHPHLRHQALHPLRRLSPGRGGRLHGTDPDAQAAGRMPPELWEAVPPPSGTACGACWKTTPAPPTSTTRNGYTEWNFLD